MKKFLAILLVFIVSVGVLAGTLVGIQSKGLEIGNGLKILNKL